MGMVSIKSVKRWHVIAYVLALVMVQQPTQSTRGLEDFLAVQTKVVLNDGSHAYQFAVGRFARADFLGRSVAASQGQVTAAHYPERTV